MATAVFYKIKDRICIHFKFNIYSAIIQAGYGLFQHCKTGANPNAYAYYVCPSKIPGPSTAATVINICYNITGSMRTYGLDEILLPKTRGQ